MSRAQKLSKTETCAVTLPKETYDFLTALAARGRLGATVSDVAAHILIEEVDKRLEAGYPLAQPPAAR